MNQAYNLQFQFREIDPIFNDDYDELDNFKSFPINLGTFNNEMPIIRLDNENDEFKINKKGTYYFIKQDIKNKNLKFDFLNSEAKLFIQGNFENVNFEFNREFNFQNDKISEIRYDKNLLTGCVNFFDTKFKNVILKNKSMREDALRSYPNLSASDAYKQSAEN